MTIISGLGIVAGIGLNLLESEYGDDIYKGVDDFMAQFIFFSYLIFLFVIMFVEIGLYQQKH
jgi:hypothetical protein